MRTFRLAMFLVFVPVAVVVANSEWVDSVVFDICRPQTLHDEYQSNLKLAKDLEDVDQEIRRRIEIKEALMHQLIAGRTTLAEVTNQFLVMNQSRPEYMADIRQKYSGCNDEERTARNVIGYAALELSRATPAQRAEVLARLETEFECFVETNTYPTW